MGEVVITATIGDILRIGKDADLDTIIGIIGTENVQEVPAEAVKGGEGSGHFGHEGRPGKVGGSRPSGRAPAKPKKEPAKPKKEPPRPSWHGKAIHIPETDQSGIPWDIINDWLMEDLCPPGESCETEWDELPNNSKEAIAAKEAIMLELSNRTGIHEEVIKRFIRQWALSSNDDDMRSLAIQRDAAELFGMPLSEFTKTKMEEAIQKAKDTIDRIWADTERAGLGERRYWSRDEVAKWVYKNTADGERARSLMFPKSQKKILGAMYEHTQERLGGITKYGDTIQMYRGVRVPVGALRGSRVGDAVWLKGNTLESWSAGEEGARYFASNPNVNAGQVGVILWAEVPVELIVGSARTGLGCLNEGEFVVLGSDGDNEAQVWDIFGLEEAQEAAAAAKKERSSINIGDTDENADWIKSLPGHEGEADLLGPLDEGDKGGPGSGHFEHEGRPGEVGGSRPSGRAPRVPKEQMELLPLEDIPKVDHPTGSLVAPHEPAYSDTVGEIFAGPSTRTLNDFFRQICEQKQEEMGSYVGLTCWDSLDHEERADVKRALLERLAERTGMHPSNINIMVKQWARSSNNESPLSLMIQYAAQEELDVELSEWQRSKIAYMGGLGGLQARVTSIVYDETRRFVRAVYDETQEQLESLGFHRDDTVVLFRGASVEAGWIEVGDELSYRGNAMESWSLSANTAESFQSSHPEGGDRMGVTMSAHVPIGNIISTAVTGMGCMVEGEVVINGSAPDSRIMIEAVQEVYEEEYYAEEEWPEDFEDEGP